MKKMIILLLAVCLLPACKGTVSDPENGDETIDEIIPLKIGNTWAYEVTVNDYTNPPTILYPYYEVSASVAGQDGDVWFTIDEKTGTMDLDWWLYPIISTTITNYKNQDDGFCLVTSVPNIGYNVSMLYKYPCEIADQSGVFVVVNLDQPITIGSTTYLCIQYANQDFGTIYVAPGLGIVKSVMFINIDNVEVTHELIGYSIN